MSAAVAVIVLIVVGIWLSLIDGDDAKSLPGEFPDDFPLYRDLNVLGSSWRDDRLTVEFDSEDAAEQIVAYYEDELRKGRWKYLLPIFEARDYTTITFTAPNVPLDNRGTVTVAEKSDSGRTKVTIEMPVEAIEAR
ncbi:MAG: hypothetical protein V3V06_00700 [Dehalococcoidia bacterium]